MKKQKTYVQVGDKWVDESTVVPETKNCPDCGEKVLKVANVCKHCGFRFAPGTDDQSASQRSWPDFTR